MYHVFKHLFDVFDDCGHAFLLSCHGELIFHYAERRNVDPDIRTIANDLASSLSIRPINEGMILLRNLKNLVRLL